MNDPYVELRRDLHSFSNPQEIRTKHLDMDLEVDFESKTLSGTVTLSFDETGAETLVLDTRDLTIHGVSTAAGEAEFELGEAQGYMGAPLTISLPAGTTRVEVRYSTSPEASGVQWLTPEQTAGKEHPFLFTQSQAIHARSWIPLQDSPGVRATYSATIRTPPELRAVMSAEMPDGGERDGEYRFEMPQAIPSYLIALAVGDLEFRQMSERTGVYAEPSVVEAAAREFEDTEAMMVAVEELYGPYRWGRYDLLVLPPSFPFGGMENPRLTFATPTILAGDKSLVGLVAHELAHSWSGNLVTNATWRDFWLNEGFTVYLESRIQEAVFGKSRADMEGALEVQGLEEELEKLELRDQVLHVDLAGRDPDEGFTGVPYTKGALLLRTIEAAVGRERFDGFLRAYFDEHAFRSIITADFLGYLNANLPEAAQAVDLEEWIERPGLPESASRWESDALAKVDAAAKGWLDGGALPEADWTTQEWLHFLRGLPEDVSTERLAELDGAFGLTESRNSEIAHRWLLTAVRRGYGPAQPRVEEFLIAVGRRKFLEPLYKALAETPEGKERARAIYAKARAGYHPISAATVDGILDW